MKSKTINIITKFLVPVFVFMVMTMPLISFGQSSDLIPCKDDCQFDDLLKLINNLVGFIFLYLALPISAIMFAYAGVVMVTSGGSTESWSKAKGIFMNTALGLIFAATSWLIVRMILVAAGYKADWQWFGFDKIN